MTNTPNRADDIIRCARSLIINGGYNSFSYADISSDDREHNGEPRDYYDFSLLNGVALATHFRASEIEVFAFRADDSLIHATNHLAMVDVAEFFQIARRSFSLPEVGLRFPLSEARPWLDTAKTV